MKKRLKINGVIMVLAALLLAVFPAFFFRQEESGRIDEIAEIFGIAFILLGQLMRICARGYKSEHSKEGNFLITSGPYSLVRNPMYLGILLIGMGIVLMLFEWWVATIFLVVFIIRYLFLIFKEEKKLFVLFPEEYPVYCKLVPHRIRPSINDLLDRDISEYLPLKLSWIKKEIGSVLAVLLITIFIDFVIDIKRMEFTVYLRDLAGVVTVIILFICLSWYLSWHTEQLYKNGTIKS